MKRIASLTLGFLKSIYRYGPARTLKRVVCHPETRVFAVFAGITGIGTLAATLLYYLLLPLLPVTAAYLVSQFSSIQLIFGLNWLEGSSRSEKACYWRDCLKFTALQSGTLVIGALLIWGFVHLLSVPEEVAIWLVYPVTFVVNFITSRLLVFRGTAA